MNFIHRLQNEVQENNRVLLERLERTQEFRSHLQGSKFANSESSDRNDWISTADVNRWLNYIENGVN